MINSFEKELREIKYRVDNVLKSCSSTAYVQNLIRDHLDTHDCNLQVMSVTAVLKHFGIPPTGKTIDTAKTILISRLGKPKAKIKQNGKVIGYNCWWFPLGKNKSRQPYEAMR